MRLTPGPRAQAIAAKAEAELTRQTQSPAQPELSLRELLAKITVYRKGALVTARLAEIAQSELETKSRRR